VECEPRARLAGTPGCAARRDSRGGRSRCRYAGLPGRDEATQAWLQALFDELGGADLQCRVQRYGFWDSGAPVDIEPEAARAAATAADCVVAKSLGTLVALTAWAGHGLRPQRSVFIGTPIAHYQAQQLALLRGYCNAGGVLFIQQTDDVTGKFAAIDALAGKLPGCAVLEVAGSDHRYDDIAASGATIAGWLNGNVT
jgi:hypothetical protein